MEMQQITVPFSRLMRDDTVNVRKFDKTAVAAMKASILAHGIIQPIAVRPPKEGDLDLEGQLYRIFAGGRRFRAMEELVTEKKIPADYAVPIIIREGDDATAKELSLAENLIRSGMDPVQEFRAFRDLIDGGLTVADVALRFGQSERFVKSRLALSKLHPEILEALEEEKIGMGAAQAYTLNPDPDVQVKFFRNAHEWQRRNEHDIKRAMNADTIPAGSRLANFIGEERYLAAGGQIVENLFGDEIYWTSASLLKTLQLERIEDMRKEALDKGWSFFETSAEFGAEMWQLKTIAPDGMEITVAEQSRMEEISEELEGVNDPDDLDPADRAAYDEMSAEYAALESKLATFSREQMAISGVVFDAERFEVKLGVIRGDNAVSGSSGSSAAEKAPRDPLALTQPLKDQIGQTATDALRARVSANPHLALALAAAMLEQAVNTTSGIGRPSRIKVERVGYEGDKDAKKRDIKPAFQHYAKLGKEELDVAFAALVADTVDLTEAWFYKDFTNDARRETTRNDFMTAFEAKPEEFFDPEAFFASSTKPMIDAAMKEMTGHSATKPKKGDMAKEAAEAARKSAWLPKSLRLKGYKIKKVA